MAERDGAGPADFSSTRLYLGNLPHNVTRQEIEQHFSKHGGEITEIKLMNGFGFLEYKNSLDANDVVPAFHGSTFMGKRLVVQFARGPRRNENYPPMERQAPRPRRTQHRVAITSLPPDTSWQDLKDFARGPGLDVVYSDIDRSGRGIVEFETAQDQQDAIEKLNKADFKGSIVTVAADAGEDRPRDRYRSRSPGPRRGGYNSRGGPPPDYDNYGRGPPPRGYSPEPRGYRRDRSPPPSRYYDDRDRGYGGPPPYRGGGGGGRGPPMDDYPPPRGGGYRDDGYGPPPSRRPPYDDPYANGGPRGGGGYSGGGGGGGGYPGGGGRSPRRGSPPPAGNGGYGGGGGGDRGYDRRW